MYLSNKEDESETKIITSDKITQRQIHLSTNIGRQKHQSIQILSFDKYLQSASQYKDFIILRDNVNRLASLILFIMNCFEANLTLKKKSSYCSGGRGPYYVFQHIFICYQILMRLLIERRNLFMS
jgi:hypothetical protein